MPDGHPVDVVADDLIHVYSAGARRLEALVRDALRRGLDPRRLNTPGQRVGDATTAYRARQYAAARAILAELERHGAAAAPVIANRAYSSSILALDHVLDEGTAAPNLRVESITVSTFSDRARDGVKEERRYIVVDEAGKRVDPTQHVRRKDAEAFIARSAGDPSLKAAVRFGGIHQQQVSIIAGNLERSLRAAAGAAGSNLDAVFARADLLDGALPAGGLRDFPRFIGRREDDVWRRFALETLARGTVALDTRRQMSDALHRRLLDEGVTDALTGFVDRAGRRWPLDTYVEMVARTTTREAASRGLVNRLEEHGQDLVTITSHPHVHDVCTPYDGKTFSLRGLDPHYPALDKLPPFHPRCRHVIGPARGLLDRYEQELGVQAEQHSAPAAPAAPSTPAPLRDEEAIAHVADKARPIPPGTEADVRYYTRGAYQTINDRLRGLEQPADATRQARQDEVIASLDKAIAAQKRTTQPITLHRYLHDGLPGDPAVGGFVDDQGFVSTSIRKGGYGPRNPTRGDTLEITAPPGTRGLDLNALNLTNAKQETEYLLERGQRLRIDSIEDLVAGGRRITATIVPRPQISPYKVRRDVLEEAAPQARPRLNVGPRHLDLSPATEPERNPFGAGRSTPTVDEHTAERLEAQRVAELVAADPGPELEAAQAWAKAVDKVARLDKKALDKVLGPDLVKEVDSAWGKRLELRRGLMSGDLTIDELEDAVEEEWAKREYKRSKRELAKQDNAFQQRSIPCFHCGRLKRRPSDVCAHCGDDPTTGIVNGDVHQQAAAHAFNRSHGFAY